MSTTGTATALEEVRRRLRDARRKTDRSALLEGVLLSLVWGATVLLAALLAEGVLHLGTVGRTMLAAAVLLVPAAVAVRVALPPFLRLLGILKGEGDEATAARVGLRFSQLKDRLHNALQLERAGNPLGISSEDLLRASLEDAQRAAAGLDFGAVVNMRMLRTHARRLAALLAAGAGVWLLFAPMMGGAAERIWNYGRDYAPPPPFLLEVEPGSQEVVRGATVPVRVRIVGPAPASVTLGSRPRGQSTFDRIPLLRDSAGSFTGTLGPMKTSTVYFAEAGDQRSAEHLLTVVDRPVLRLLRLSLAFPSYTGLAARQLEDNVGDVTALKGTRIFFRVESTKDLVSAALVFGGGEETALTTEGTTASGTVTLTRDRTYTLRLTDPEGLTNQDPITYRITAVADQPPQITVEAPGGDRAVTDREIVNILVRLRDDFGFSALRLAHRLVESRYERPSEAFTVVPIPLPAGPATELLVPHRWALEGLNLVPEDVVSYYLEVADNDRVSGPKTARSPLYTLRLPSMEEVFAEADRGHESGLQSLQQALEQAQEARKEMEDLQKDLRQQKARLDWQEQKKAEEMLKKYDEVRKKLDEVQQTVDRMVQQMEQNRALSPETLEKYQELQRMMEELNSPELAEAMKRMQQAMQQMTPEMMRDALKNFSFSEENFRKSIERTMNLLKRLQIEQKMEEAIRRAEEMLKNQTELAERTEQAAKDRTSAQDLARRQEELRKNAEDARASLEDLAEKMEEFPAEMPLEELAEARRDLDSAGLGRQMRESARELASERPESSLQRQRQAMQSMGEHLQQLQRMQKSMQSNQQRQAMDEMRRSLQDLVDLSQRQEELKNRSRALDQNSQAFRENAAAQMEVLRDLSALTERMSTLSQKTFAVTPEMGKAIGDAMRRMNDAMQALEQRDGQQAGGQQEGAMASLNQAASMVQAAMNSMMQGGGPGGTMASFLQRLQQMSAQQQGINDGTRQQGGLSPQQQAEMGRLAGEQGMVRKSLEQLAREASQAGELSRMLGDLNRTAQEMREVQTDLARGDVSPETLRKQERILSRLLDAQRSTRERDYEKQRRAQTAASVPQRRSPGPLDMTGEEGRERLRQDLLRALEEGYVRDYEELIRKYFEALDAALPAGRKNP